MAANGGKRAGAGRKKGVPNKATVLRQQKQAAVIAEAIDSGKPMAITVLQKAMEFAEGAVATFRPTMQGELATGKPKNPDGDLEEFGKWFDRWYKCIAELAAYQTAKIKATEAPTPAPAPGSNKKRFTLRVFEGGRPSGLPAVKEDDAA